VKIYNNRSKFQKQKLFQISSIWYSHLTCLSLIEKNCKRMGEEIWFLFYCNVLGMVGQHENYVGLKTLGSLPSQGDNV